MNQDSLDHEIIRPERKDECEERGPESLGDYDSRNPKNAKQEFGKIDLYRKGSHFNISFIASLCLHLRL
jgi:hypothetical protein